MDVEQQTLKNLPRDAQSTVSVIDDYCAIYKDLFKEVRNYECFKYLHLGIISPIKNLIVRILRQKPQLLIFHSSTMESSNRMEECLK